MSDITLVIGNKNYSSWSLRPWVLMRHLQLAFDELLIALFQPDIRSRIAQHSPAGRVPVLKHGNLTVWESLAIGEYLCELTGRGWPPDPPARAQARAVSAEMHAGFGAAARPVADECTRHRPAHADVSRAARRYRAHRCAVARLPAALWCARPMAVRRLLAGGRDVRPVALRFRTYGATLSAPAQAYLDTVLADPPLQQWIAAAALEPWSITDSEVGLPAG